MDEAAMDALPDELLLHILAFVRDARTLLLAVPLVCKRWHRLHRDPRLWADVDVDVDVCWDDEDAARVLLHAPAVRNLRVDAVLSRARVIHPRLALALGRTSLKLSRGLTVTRSSTKALRPDELPAVERLLRVCGPALRELDVYLQEDDDSLLRAIAGLRGSLEKLRLHIGGFGLDRYDTQFLLGAGGLPSLRELRVYCERGTVPWLLRPKMPAGLIEHLAEAAAGTLRVLEVDLCEGTDLDAVAASLMTRGSVEELVLRVHVDDEEGADENAVAVEKAVRACVPMASLRRLQVRLDRGYPVYSPDREALCRGAVQGFARRRPDVEMDFHIEGISGHEYEGFVDGHPF